MLVSTFCEMPIPRRSALNRRPHSSSETLAERDAWALARTLDGESALTTVLPGFIQGPALGPAVSGSLELPLRMLTGRVPFVPRVSFAGVDTRDVAELHLKALADPRAWGQRIIAAADPLWMREIAATLKAHLGDKASKVSTRQAPDWVVRAAALFSSDARFLVPDLGKRRTYNASLAETILGRPLRRTRAAVVDAGESLIAEGLA